MFELASVVKYIVGSAENSMSSMTVKIEEQLAVKLRSAPAHSGNLKQSIEGIAGTKRLIALSVRDRVSEDPY